MSVTLLCAFALPPRAVHALNSFFAQLALVGELQDRLDAGARRRHGIRRVQPALLRGFGGGLAREVRHAGKVAFGERQDELLFVRQHVLAELRAEAGQFLHDRRQPRAAFAFQFRAGAHEVEVIALPARAGSRRRAPRPASMRRYA